MTQRLAGFRSQVDPTCMVHLDLFSGIGGFALAIRWAGVPITASYHSDVDTFANGVYAKRFPQSKQLGDVRGIDGRALRVLHPDDDWIVTGGFPCQDISSAGRQRGIHAARSGLWFEMRRIIGEIGPKVVVAENVRRLCAAGLSDVLRSLADIGYDARWDVVSAADVGAPHLRERVWVTAHPASPDRHLHADPTAVQAPADDRDVGEFVQPARRDDPGGVWPDWAATAAAGSIPASPRVLRVDDGLSARLDERAKLMVARGRALGNAIVPQVAERIIRRAVSDAGIAAE